MTVTGSVRSHLSPSTSMMGCSGDADEAVAGAAGPRRFSASTLRVPLGSEASAMEFDGDGAEEGVTVGGGVFGGLLGEFVGRGRRGMLRVR